MGKQYGILMFYDFLTALTLYYIANLNFTLNKWR